MKKKTQIITCTCYIYKKSLPKVEIPASAINKKDTKVFKRHESKNNIAQKCFSDERCGAYRPHIIYVL